MVKPRFERLRDHRLEGINHERSCQPDHFGDVGGPAGDSREDFAGLDVAAIGMDTDHRAIANFDIGDGGLLVDFGSVAIGATRVGPGDGVVTGNRTRWMKQGPVNGWLMTAASQVDLGDL